MDREYDFEAVMSRLKTITNAGSYNELAEMLGISSSGYANYKKRNSIPFEKVAALAHSRNVSMDWVLTGEGSIHRGGAAERASYGTGIKEPPPEHPLKKAMAEILKGLGEEEQRQVLEEAAKARELLEMKKRLAELEQRAGTGGATQNFHKPVKNVAGRDVRHYYGNDKSKK